MGMAIARAIKREREQSTILVLDKEPHEAFHASSRNSGVLHAGFYYTANSLKAQLTVAGNQAMKEFCREKNLPINECGKLVVAQNEQERDTLYELEKRGQRNGSDVVIVDTKRVRDIDPNVKTFEKALWSPNTASVNPKQVCRALYEELKQNGVEFKFETSYRSRRGNVVCTNQGDFEADKVINCAGLYAETIAADFGFGAQYTMIPFKGLYLKYTKNKTDVSVNIYPVPNLRNPFLGVHYTKTVDGSIKIGPTAIPALWKEQYGAWDNFKIGEMLRIGFEESRLFVTNAFGFRGLAFEEMRKYRRDYFVQLAVDMVHEIDPAGFTEFTPPGIRAQLLNKKIRQLVQDFVVEGDGKSIHVLNAVSPAFTCSFAFADFMLENYEIL